MSYKVRDVFLLNQVKLRLQVLPDAIKRLDRVICTLQDSSSVGLKAEVKFSRDLPGILAGCGIHNVTSQTDL